VNIAVCVKQIPDPATPYELDPETHFVVRPEDQVMDDTDRYGVEVALQLAEESEGSVTVISMSPAGSLQGIRQALAMGADQAIVINDDALRGAGALVTAQVLAAAVKRAGAELVIAGTESTDGYTGVVPQQVAELLDAPALTYARKVERAAGKIRVEQQSAGGYNVVESDLPAVVVVTAGVVEPRYPTFKGIMAAKSKPVDEVTAVDLGVDNLDSGQRIAEVKDVPSRQAGEIVEDDGEAHTKIVEILEQVKAI
jgi:electron transfer flavoprotein beta subunit